MNNDSIKCTIKFDSLIFKRIVQHDLEIIVEHFSTVPFLLIREFPFVFIFGGQTWLENHIYSEVYLVTLLFYFGIFRLGIFLTPFILSLRFKQRDTLLISTIVLMSLGHYYIFKNGVNILCSTFVIASFIERFKKKSFTW